LEDLGSVEVIRDAFNGFQRYLYESVELKIGNGER